MKHAMCLIAIVLPVFAQPSSVTGPVLGVVFDAASGRVRPLTGIPASATLGDPFDSNTLSTAVSASVFAIGVDAGSGATVLVSQSESIPVAGAKSGASRIAVSPLGRSAAIYFPDADTVQIVGGLPSNPRVTRELVATGTPSAMAVSDDGDSLVIATVQEDGESVSQDNGGQGLRLLRRVGHASSIEFFPDSRNSLVADSISNSVWLIQHTGGYRQVSPSGAVGITDIVGVAGSADGSGIFIATRSGRIAVVNINSGEQKIVECPCQASGLSRLRGSAVFRLNEVGAETLWLLDASDDPRVLFVAASARGEQ